MKIKIFTLIFICILLSMLIAKQNELITIPKEERSLKQTSEKILKGKVSKFNDGDTFILEGDYIIRLFGIDAPEYDQTCLLHTEIKGKGNELIVKDEEIKCGQESKNKLSDLIYDNEVFCIIRGKDAYDRFVADCGFERYNKNTKRKDRININKEMVLSGHAIAFQKITDKYLEDEHRAKAGNKGIWATTFLTPSDYRKKTGKE